MQSWIRIKERFRPDCLTVRPLSRFAHREGEGAGARQGDSVGGGGSQGPSAGGTEK